jgi:DNA-binding transcriptional regulator YiaG
MDGCDKMKGSYHYTGCGLDNIYLANGFEHKVTPYGEGVSIADADGLHAAIAKYVISSPNRLRGQEVRFLRSMLNVSQAGLGDILGVSRATVARWEGKNSDAPIPSGTDRFLRLFYALKVAGHRSAQKVMKLLSEIDDLEQQLAICEDTALGWIAQKEAA